MSGNGANIWNPGDEEILITNSAGTYIRETQTLAEGQTVVTLSTFKFALGVNCLQTFVDGVEVGITEINNQSFSLPFAAAAGQSCVVWGLFGASGSLSQNQILVTDANIAASLGSHLKAGDNIGVSYNPVSGDTTISAGTGKTFKNKLINPFFRTDYRNKKAAITPANIGVGWICDRWHYNQAAASKLTYQPSAPSTIPGFESCLKVTVANAVAPAAGDAYMIYQQILASNLQELQWNTAKAKDVYILVAVKSSVSGKFPFKLHGLAAPYYGYVGYMDVVAGVPMDYAIKVPGAVVFALLTGVQPLLQLSLMLGYGSGHYESNINTWKAAAELGPADGMQFVSVPAATIEITGLELGVGAPTEREFLPLEVEEELCAKYFESMLYPTVTTVALMAQAITGGAALACLTYRQKIKNPLILSTGTSSLSNSAGGTIAVTGLTAPNPSKISSHINLTCGGGLVAGNASAFVAGATGLELIIDADW